MGIHTEVLPNDEIVRDDFQVSIDARISAFQDRVGRHPETFLERLRIFMEARHGVVLPDDWEEQARDGLTGNAVVMREVRAGVEEILAAVSLEESRPQLIEDIGENRTIAGDIEEEL